MKLLSVITFSVFLSLSVLFSDTSSKWIELALYDVPGYGICKATSELNGDNGVEVIGKYSVMNLLDKNFSTAWVEGKQGDGINESVYIVIPEECKTINIFNGYGKNSSLYHKNNRPKKIKLSSFVGINPDGYVSETAIIYKAHKFEKDFYITLKDTYGIQSFKFPFSKSELETLKNTAIDRFKEKPGHKIGQIDFILKLEIEEIYKGSKWDDTCISEIFFNDRYICNKHDEIFNKIKNVYVNQKENAIYMDTETEKKIMLLQDSNSVYQISEISKDKQWVTVIRMPADAGTGRVDTEYLILNTHFKKLMCKDIAKIAGNDIYGPFFLINKNDNLFLEYHEQGKPGTKLIELK